MGSCNFAFDESAHKQIYESGRTQGWGRTWGAPPPGHIQGGGMECLLLSIFGPGEGMLLFNSMFDMWTPLENAKSYHDNLIRLRGSERLSLPPPILVTHGGDFPALLTLHYKYIYVYVPNYKLYTQKQHRYVTSSSEVVITFFLVLRADLCKKLQRLHKTNQNELHGFLCLLVRILWKQFFLHHKCISSS